ncbi:hypothetical protein PFICI_02463 [Pestalotiopsis fici W106-1]|uniref:4-hydroxy-4-methyl-2-oxoglutarate aldolase n=1 Tax=Pestalotiopsis fici (strain W106-1 / CGMCC3.15140) TaxID=1229662 RepID=W3XEA9_PESFW|nr:uncharacterized protein PFICI_02463 [Pestalotiopsis fici W106-1]ETS84438.1 hypothetical protein PFICI_02463 [Pestalotiopsis fici W106-1]
MASDKLKELAQYSACDISDALLKFDVPNAGFLPDIVPLQTSGKIVAPATTVLFVSKTTPSFPGHGPEDHLPSPAASSNIPTGSIYSDLMAPGTIAVLSQPQGSVTATMGSVHAARMNKLGVKGVLVDGRVRDVQYLKEELDMPVWCKTTSLVATKGQCKAHGINVPIDIGGTRVTEGDIIVLDPAENGALCIPKDKVDQVLELVARLVELDRKTMADIALGCSVEETSQKYVK